MDGYGLVFIGIDVVADGLDVAETRRWTRKRAPRGLWRRLGVRTGVLLWHADAPVQVALVPADASVRGVGETRGAAFRLKIDENLFAEVVEDCPVVDALVGELTKVDASVAA